MVYHIECLYLYAACIWLVQVRTMLIHPMTKQAKSKTHSVMVEAPEFPTLARVKELQKQNPPERAVAVFTCTKVSSTLGFASCSSLRPEELIMHWEH